MIKKLLRTLSLPGTGLGSWAKFYTHKVLAAPLQLAEVCQHFYDKQGFWY